MLFVSYLLQADPKLWAKFKKRLNKEGRKVGATLLELIERYVEHGIPDQKDKDT